MLVNVSGMRVGGIGVDEGIKVSGAKLGPSCKLRRSRSILCNGDSIEAAHELCVESSPSDDESSWRLPMEPAIGVEDIAPCAGIKELSDGVTFGSKALSRLCCSGCSE